MMDEWRLLRDGIVDPFLHFAVEEGILREVSREGSPYTLRLRRVKPSVFIGVTQDADEEVDVDYCRRHHIPIVRRPNPGGAVYQDHGSFCYSAFFKKAFLAKLGVASLGDLYRVFGRAVLETCAHYGVDADISPVNDVTINGRKVYGSAQLEWYSGVAHSGTFLVDADVETMQHVLRPSRLKFADKGFTRVRDRVINLSEAGGRHLDVEEVMECLAENIARELDITMKPGNLTSKELQESRRLYKDKYALEEWTFRRRGHYTTIVSTKIPSGVMTLSAHLAGDILESVSVTGDFLIPDLQKLELVVEQLHNQTLPEAIRVAESSSLPAEIKNALLSLLQNVEVVRHEK